MDIFYKPGIDSDLLTLDPSESMHCIKVMRYKKGNKVSLIDGIGGFYVAQIITEDPKSCKIAIESYQKNYESLPYELHIAIAPTKSIDRFEWFLEKATEIGITSISPLLCQRSERRSVRIDRMEKVVVAAMKQSVKAYLPVISEMVRFDDWVKMQKSGSKFIAHCMEGPKKSVWQAGLTARNTIVIGPEGDFTPGELELAENCGFEPVSLGAYRLRTETAGVVACSAVYFAMHL